MKRFHSLIISLFACILWCESTTYKILFVNHPQIIINAKFAKVGDTFNENAIIKWSKDRQAMKVIDIDSKKRYLMVAKPTDKKELTVQEILTHINHLSTHNPGDNIPTSDFDQLEYSIASQYYLLDEIVIPTKLPVNENHYFIGSFKYGDTQISKRLDYRAGSIIIDKNLFHIGNQILRPQDILLTIDYIVKSPSNSVFIKDNISIIIIPKTLDYE